MEAFLNGRSLFLRKRIALSALLMIVVAVIGFLIIPTAFAGANDFAKTLMQDIVDMICGAQLKECKEIMLGENSMFMDAAVTTVGATMAKSLKAMAAFLAVIYTTVGLIRNMIKGEGTLQAWSQFLLRLALSLTFLLSLDTIITWIETLGKAIVNLFVDKMLEFDLTKEWEELKAAGNIDSIFQDTGNQSGVSGLLNQAGQAIDEALENTPILGDLYQGAKTAFNWANGFWQSLYMSMQLMFPYLIFRLLNLYTKTISYALFFELAVRRVFMPIAAANIMSEGIHSPGVEYLKRYLAVYVRMAVILVTLAIAWNLMLATISRYCPDISYLFIGLSASLVGPAATAANVGGNVMPTAINIWDCVMMLSAAHVLMKKAGDYANEVIGTVTI